MITLHCMHDRARLHVKQLTTQQSRMRGPHGSGRSDTSTLRRPVQPTLAALLVHYPCRHVWYHHLPNACTSLYVHTTQARPSTSCQPTRKRHGPDGSVSNHTDHAPPVALVPSALAASARQEHYSGSHKPYLRCSCCYCVHVLAIRATGSGCSSIAAGAARAGGTHLPGMLQPLALQC